MKIHILLYLLLTGCMVGPNYSPPAIDMPMEFIEAKNTSTSDSNFYQWWTQFNDPCLDSLIAEAVEANFDVRLALERIEQARAQAQLAGAQLWPEIDLDATATRTRNSQNFLNSSSASGSSSSSSAPTSPYENFFRLGFDAIWEIDFFGKFRRGKRAAYFAWEASTEAAQAVLISVLSEVAVTYVSIRAIQQKIALTLEEIKTDREKLILTNDLFQAGLASELDIDALLAVLENDRAAVPVLEMALKQMTYALALLLGRQPESFQDTFLEIRPIPLAVNKIPIGLPSDLLQRRPDIKQAERRLAAATEQIGVAVADLFPHITLTGTTLVGGSLGGSSYGFESNRLSNLLKSPSRFWSIGPNILWDMIDFGRVRANIDIQNSLQRQALLTYEQTVITALKDVEGALVAYFEEEKRNLLLDRQVITDQRSLQLNEDLFQSGLIDELQVLTARKTLLAAKSTLIDSQQALISDLISVYKALGGTWECFYSP